jgi:RNA polymerase sigma-70 factor (ECF subfamily)
MSDNSQEIEVLAKKAKLQDMNSMEQLINIFYQDIYRLVLYRTYSKMDAEDITQEIFMQSVKKIKYLKDTKKFKAWLYRIALNRVIDFHKKKKILSFCGMFLEINTQTNDDQIFSKPCNYPEKIVLKKEFWQQLNSFTKQLSKKEREIFLLRFVDLLEIKDISQVLKKNENTIKTHLYRALKKFRKNSEFINLLQGEEL